MQYRTEIEIPPDRYVCLQLPDFIPEGEGTVTITTPDPDRRHEPRAEDEAEDHDIEWWDEFDGDGHGRDGR